MGHGQYEGGWLADSYLKMSFGTSQAAADGGDRWAYRLAWIKPKQINCKGDAPTYIFAMTDELEAGEKFRWIMKSGWKGTCPRCGEASMFVGWLKIVDRCPSCQLNYNFASPDDGPAFFSLCIVAFPLTFLLLWVEIVHSPPLWVHLLTTFPAMALGCVLPLRPIKGWLVASQFVNQAQEAGTAASWARLNGLKDASDESVE